MLNKAIAKLEKAGLNIEELFTAREIAEMLWLAVHLDSSLPSITEEKTTSTTQETETNQDQSSLPNQDLSEESQDTTIEDESNQNSSSQSEIPIYLLDSETKTKSQQKSQPSKSTNFPTKLPIKVPAATALRNSLLLGRALRPLMLKIPSKTEAQLDEKATAERIAQQRIRIPVVNPIPQRWLELAIVIEQTPSTYVWQSTINEWQKLLKYHGAFRDVRLWGLREEQNKFQLLGHKGRGKYGDTPHSLKELIDSKGNRLILLVSDCISNSWRNGRINSVLDLWSNKGLLTIIQLLPERLWHRTALESYPSVELKSYQSLNSNSELNVKFWEDQEEDEEELEESIKLKEQIKSQINIPIPIVTLEVKPLLNWSKVMAGYGNAATVGFIFSSSSVKSDSEELEEELSALDLVNRFRATASPLARRLGVLMAATPVNVSIAHLIQQTLVPESKQIHLAEVFMSGILKPKQSELSQGEDKPENNQSSLFINNKFPNHDYIEEYEFVEEVREILLDSIPKNEIKLVMQKVSEFIANKLGLSVKDFEATLLNNNFPHQDNVDQILRPFAQIKTQVLKRLGGTYAQFAEKIEQAWETENKETDQVIDETDTLNQDLSDKLSRQTETVTVATIEFQFEFDVVKIVRKQPIKNRLLLGDIHFGKDSDYEAFSRKGRYQNYKELSNNETEGQDYRIRFRQGNSDVAIVANHGGKIQLGTTQIADAIAGEDYSFYTFEGIKEGVKNDPLHIPSHRFDESRALNLVSNANRVIAIHGTADKEEVVYLGGLDVDFKEQIKQALIKEDLTNINDVNKYFKGISPLNICNRGKTGKGVQRGLSWALRKKLFDSLKSEDKNQLTLFDRFIQAIRDAISPVKIIKDDRLEASGWQYQTYRGQASYFSEQLPVNSEQLEDSEVSAEEGNSNQELIPLDLVYIPSGKFMMGTEEEEIKRLTEKFGDYFKYESPQHELTVQPFYLSKYPITQRQWKAIAERTDLKVKEDLKLEPSYFKDNPKSFSFPSTRGNSDLPYYGQNPSYLDRPVEKVNWYQAKEFCDRLSKLTGKEYRLPSEAEWEYACRADPPKSPLIRGTSDPPKSPTPLPNGISPNRGDRGTSESPSQEGGTSESPSQEGGISESPSEEGGISESPSQEGGISESLSEEGGTSDSPTFQGGARGGFHFGETITSDLANYNGKNIYADEPKGVYRGETTPVGIFPPNAFGLYDMHGNVWEWCEDDWHHNYNNAPNDGSAWLDPKERTAKLLRGGSFDGYPNNCRSASRPFNIVRAYIDLYAGFRVVCVLPRTGKN